MGIFIDILRWFENKLFTSKDVENVSFIFNHDMTKVSTNIEEFDNGRIVTISDIPRLQHEFYWMNDIGDLELPETIDLKPVGKGKVVYMFVKEIFVFNFYSKFKSYQWKISISIVDKLFDKHLCVLKYAHTTETLFIDGRYLNFKRDSVIRNPEIYELRDNYEMYLSLFMASPYISKTDNSTYWITGKHRNHLTFVSDAENDDDFTILDFDIPTLEIVDNDLSHEYDFMLSTKFEYI